MIMIPMRRKINEENLIPINTIIKRLGKLDFFIHKFNFENDSGSEHYAMIILPTDYTPYSRKKLCAEIIPNISNLPQILLNNQLLTEYSKVCIPILNLNNYFDMNNIFKQIIQNIPLNEISFEITKDCKENNNIPDFIQMVKKINIGNNNKNNDDDDNDDDDDDDDDEKSQVSSRIVKANDDGVKKIIKLNIPFVFCYCIGNVINSVGIFMGK